MVWAEGRYLGICRYCGDVKEYDATLGMGGKPSSILETNGHDGFQRDWVEE